MSLRGDERLRRIGPIGRIRPVGRLVAALCVAAAAAIAEPRFPEPEFETGHVLPTTTHPLPAPVLSDWLALGILAITLALSAYFTHRARSRKGIFAVMLFSLVYFGFLRQGCICPIGALQNVVQALFDAQAAVPLTVLGFFLLPLIAALFFGRVFCGGVCFFGALQDLVIVRPARVPTWLARSLGMLAWIYLGNAVLFAATGSGFIICRSDPFVGLLRLSGPAPALALGACFLVLGAFVARPYCRFVCPYGVLLGWLSHLSRWRTTITPDECIQCRLCEDSCPFGAILKPNTAQSTEPRHVSARRLGLLLALLPVLAAAGAWAGTRLAAVHAAMNRNVQVAEQIAAENAGSTTKTSLASQAFRTAGRSMTDLNAQAADIRAQFARVGMWIGAVLGLAFGLQLVRFAVPQSRTDYEPDRGLCLSCGRCFSYCPREQRRRRSDKSITDVPPTGGPEPV